MKTTVKELYEEPSMTVVEVHSEGIVCASGDEDALHNYIIITLEEW